MAIVLKSEASICMLIKFHDKTKVTRVYFLGVRGNLSLIERSEAEKQSCMVKKEKNVDSGYPFSSLYTQLYST